MHSNRSDGKRSGPVRWQSALGLAGVALLAAGCMTTKVDETRQVATAIQANESIVVLRKPA